MKNKSLIPSIKFTDSGLKAPDEADILDGAISDLNQAMGGAMSKSLSTPQGQIAMSNTAIIANNNAHLVNLANQVNPDFSSGRFQDAIGRIYFMNRKPASGTVVNAVCGGTAGITIPQGAIAQDDNGYLYVLNNAVTIPESGKVEALFINTQTGMIPCAIGALSTIYKGVDGWSDIYNPTVGVLGSDVEGRNDFEYRRRQSVAKNARGSNEAVYGSVFDVDGVVDAYVIDNPTSVPMKVGYTEYELLPHSLYVCAYGGEKEEIAKAIWKKKSPGCNMNGNIEVIIFDKENYQEPYPQYNIKFQAPNVIDVCFKVSVYDNKELPSGYDLKIIESIKKSFMGGDGGTKARIGATMRASRFYCGLVNIGGGITIDSISISRDGSDYLNILEFGIDEIPAFNEMNVMIELI